MSYRKAFAVLCGVLMAAWMAGAGVPDALAAKTVKAGLFPFGPGRMVDQYIMPGFPR